MGLQLPMISVEGHVEPGWDRVAEEFRKTFESYGEVGAALSVYQTGRPVVDLWAGIADKRSGRAWNDDTVAVVFSTTKGATAICAHMLVEQGKLNLDAPVAQYWPAFAGAGKEKVLVRHLLSHQAGLVLIDAKLTTEDACAWNPVIRALESQKPLWPAGSQVMYHSLTFGFLIGELVRRVTGMTLGAFFADAVAAPLGLDAWIGLPIEIRPRVAHLEPATDQLDSLTLFVRAMQRLGKNTPEIREAYAAVISVMEAPESPYMRDDLGGSFPFLVTEDGYHNDPAVWGAELPSTNLISDARSLARMYAATIGTIDGVRLLNRETVATMSTVTSTDVPRYGMPVPGTDGLPAAAQTAMDLYQARYSLGFWSPFPAMPLLGPRSFGHPGFGGSLAFADPDAEIALGYVPNHMGSDLRRTRDITAAITQLL